MLRIHFIIGLTAFLLTSLVSQDRFANVEIKEHKLSENIYMLEGAGGNIGLVIGEKEILLIDDQYGPLSDKIMAKVKMLSGGTVTKLVNTHWHGDHTGGNANFGEAGAMIFAHKNVRERMSNEHIRGENVTPASPEIALPVVTFDEGMQLHFFGEPVMVIHVHEAHTDGDAFVYLPESNVLHMGDCFFNKRFPFIDVSSGGSISGIIKAAETALMLVDDNTQIIPGHGPMASKEDLQGYHNFLKIVKEKIQEHIASGRDVESLDASKVVEGYADWEWGFIDASRFTNIVFSSLTKVD